VIQPDATGAAEAFGRENSREAGLIEQEGQEGHKSMAVMQRSSVLLHCWGIGIHEGARIPVQPNKMLDVTRNWKLGLCMRNGAGVCKIH
jgi:hypothetical protein